MTTAAVLPHPQLQPARPLPLMPLFLHDLEGIPLPSTLQGPGGLHLTLTFIKEEMSGTLDYMKRARGSDDAARTYPSLLNVDAERFLNPLAKDLPLLLEAIDRRTVHHYIFRVKHQVKYPSPGTTSSRPVASDAWPQAISEHGKRPRLQEFWNVWG
jgi:hypothetical protein